MNRNTYNLLLLIAIIFFSCSSDKKIFQIKTVDDLQKVIKKTSEKIDKKNTKLLTSNEIMYSKYEYRELKIIYQNTSFKARLILSTIPKTENYNIIIRTYNIKSGKIIDSFLLCSYNKNIKNSFCKGTVTSNLKISRFCNDFNSTKQINEFGKFVNLK